MLEQIRRCPAPMTGGPSRLQVRELGNDTGLIGGKPSVALSQTRPSLVAHAARFRVSLHGGPRHAAARGAECPTPAEHLTDPSTRAHGERSSSAPASAAWSMGRQASDRGRAPEGGRVYVT